MTEQTELTDQLADLSRQLRLNYLARRRLIEQLQHHVSAAWKYGHPREASRAHPAYRHLSEHRRASPGHFKVIAEDREYFGDAWGVCEYQDLGEAITCAETHARYEPTEYYHVYDDRGRLIYPGCFKDPIPWGEDWQCEFNRRRNH